MIKMKKKSTIIFILILLFSLSIYSQEVISFDKALVLKTFGMNRRSVKQIDPIEYKIVNGTYKIPSQQDEFIFCDTTYTWNEINSDSSGWFRSNLLKSGYASVTYFSDKDKIMILEGKGYTHSYVNQIPRYGNVYKFSDNRNSWEPEWGFLFLPVKIKKGKNEFLFQCYYGGMKAVLHNPKAVLQINNFDVTLPTLVFNKAEGKFGGIVILNNLDENVSGYKIKTYGKGFEERISQIPKMIPLSVHKTKFDFYYTGKLQTGDHPLTIEILDKNDNVIHSSEIQIEIKKNNETYKETFISKIDGSVQYYAVNPSKDKLNKNALFLSLHGAAVEAYNQARSYNSKKWGVIVSPTNRRPYGFNWEDWGRLDALEVLEIAKNKFNINKEKVYLTGHSMGGHGTWHIGATFPEKFAAIAPSAGWISFDSYRYQNKKISSSEVKKLINRTGNPSDTYTLAQNYYNHGIYIIHGKDDKVVTVKQPYSMIEVLKTFHKDYEYYEEPGVGHWWDKNDEDGADCVDWQPMFDFFARKSRMSNETIRHIKFKTASPGISSDYYWVTIYDQKKYFNFSSVDLVFDPGKNRVTGYTDNVRILNIETEIFDLSKPMNLEIDNQKITIDKVSGNKIWFQKTDNIWIVISKPSMTNKNPERFGSFKDAFRNNMVFVYATNGSKEENEWCINKVRYDAEQFWYQGNGSVEIISDKEFDKNKYKNRNIILFGNSETNLVWQDLLNSCPIKISKNKIEFNNHQFTGDDLICLMIYPKNNNSNTCIGVVAATGIKGMKLLEKRPYLKPGFTYPDFTIMDSKLLIDSEKGYKAAGFFGFDWSLKNSEYKIEK